MNSLILTSHLTCEVSECTHECVLLKYAPHMREVSLGKLAQCERSEEDEGGGDRIPSAAASVPLLHMSVRHLPYEPRLVAIVKNEG